MRQETAQNQAFGRIEAPLTNDAVLRFSTANYVPAEQFAAWRDATDSVLQVSLPPGASAEEGYAAEITAYHLGNLIVSVEAFGATDYQLPPDKLRRHGVDHWMLTLNKGGAAVSRTGDLIMNSRC